MSSNSINTRTLTMAFTRSLAVLVFFSTFVTLALAQQASVFMGVKTGNLSGAGSYGSKIVVKITFVNKTGAVEVGESTLGNATLSADVFSMAQLSMSYDLSLRPAIKSVRLENRGTDSVITGDNWYCEYICVKFDGGNGCGETIPVHRWINGGVAVELANPHFRQPEPDAPPPRPDPVTPPAAAPAPAKLQVSVVTNQNVPVPNAKVIWVDEQTGRQGSMFTDASGIASSSRVTPGVKTVSAEIFGFQKSSTTGLNLDPGSGTGIQLILIPENANATPAQPEATTPAPDPSTRDANGDTLLHQAVRARDRNTAEDMLRRGIDVNTKNNAGFTPLHDAIGQRDQSMVSFLLQNRANPNAPDAQGNSPVALAADARNPQMLLALLEAGGDATVAANQLVLSKDEQTFRTVVEKYRVSVTNEMFTAAIRNRSFGIAELSLGHGVDPNFALDTALRSNVRQLIEPALRAGANADSALQYAMQKRDSALAQLTLNKYNANADLALRLAIPNNDLTVLQMALQKGADANSGMEPAAKLGNQPMVEALLNGRADPNLGLLPAVQAGKGRIVELLVTRGANPNPAMPFAVKSNDTQLVTVLLRANADGRDPQLMALAAGNQNLAMVKMLLTAGADANAGMEAAVTANSLEVTRFLLENKADATNPSLIALGAKNGNQPMVTMFLERGADPTAGLGGAVVGGHAPLVDYLLKNKANGTDPRLIAHAASKGDARVTALLLAAGAEAEAGMKTGVTSGSAEVVTMLIKAGASAKAPDYILSACQAGNTALAVVLLKNEAPKDVMDGRGQPLMQIAALTWRLDLVNALLENGVDANLKNQAGETALLIVARDEASPGYPKFKKMKKGRLPILNALIAGKANVNAANNKGEFVLKVADGGDVKDLLKAAGAVKDQKELDKRGQ